MNILLVCERSGGHVFPALCFAKKFSREKGNNVTFFASSGFLKKHIEGSGFSVVGRVSSSRNLALEGARRFFEALRLIIKLKPDKVIGLGGRDSFFLVLLSALLFIDTAIYEPNVRMGKANKVLSFFVRKIMRGFEGNKKSKRIVNIGVILRENIKKIDKLHARSILGFNEAPVVLCFGGSQGASFINNMFIRFCHEFDADYQIIHLTGKDDYFKILPLYDKFKNNKFIKEFYHDMQVLYSASDIVVCRAGASTLGEISFYQLPSILIPYIGAGGHQKDNASYFEKRSSALIIPQNDYSFEDFQVKLKKLISDSNLRSSLQDNLSKVKLGVNFEDFCNNTSI